MLFQKLNLLHRLATGTERAVHEGKVVRMAPGMNATERVLPVWIEVDNPGGKLIEGMLARVEIDMQSESVALAPSPQ